MSRSFYKRCQIRTAFVLLARCSVLAAHFQIDTMIRQCFQTLCKEWMSECHWYCDSKRCKDCLSWRGQQCMDCFEL
ncbi:unnamed protein product [Haemonchus placei]|uniref:Uncharacterized protein n=1 Tax=Haemonchus placei TaxID=6290 RepID=A0A3P7UIZ3_HAEPC|nr:unnamed protein product [Haemonchus placei]